MRIVSWNVNGIRASYSKGLVNAVQALKPDVLCLQETKAHPEQLKPEVLSLGWERFDYSSCEIKKGYSGTATYSKKEPLSVARGIGHQEFDQEGRFLITEYKDFLLYNIYFPNGGSGPERCEYKERFNDAFFEHLEGQMAEGQSVIVVGDYNVAHTELDIYDPQAHEDESGFLLQERQWFSDLLELGMIDTFRHFHPEAEERYTWWSYRERARPVNRGWRIDYICVSPDLEDLLVGADIHDEVMGSDHCPVSVDLDLEL